MPDFHEVQLDVGIDYGMTGGAEFETEIVATAGGRETRGIGYPGGPGERATWRPLDRQAPPPLPGWVLPRPPWHGLWIPRENLGRLRPATAADRRGERQPRGGSDLQNLPRSLPPVPHGTHK